MATNPRCEHGSSRAARAALLIAAAAGTVHGLFSAYWGLGGNWLVGTLGRQLVDEFTGKRWLLLPVAAIKIAFAVLPLVLARLAWLGGKWWRILCWAGVVVLVVWGGVNTVTGNLVLAGVVAPAGGYDHDAMVGHAWLWDPLFLLWGIALAMALLRTGRKRVASARCENS